MIWIALPILFAPHFVHKKTPSERPTQPTKESGKPWLGERRCLDDQTQMSHSFFSVLGKLGNPHLFPSHDKTKKGKDDPKPLVVAVPYGWSQSEGRGQGWRMLTHIFILPETTVLRSSAPNRDHSLIEGDGSKTVMDSCS